MKWLERFRPKTKGEVMFLMGTVGNILATVIVKETTLSLHLHPEETVRLAWITHLVFDAMNPIAAFQMVYLEGDNWLHQWAQRSKSKSET